MSRLGSMSIPSLTATVDSSNGLWHHECPFESPLREREVVVFGGNMIITETVVSRAPSIRQVVARVAQRAVFLDVQHRSGIGLVIVLGSVVLHG
jgi:hypothetical protein